MVAWGKWGLVPALVLLSAACAPGAPSGASTIEGQAPPGFGPSSLTLERQVVPFPVHRADGTPYEFPFLGGIEVPRIQFADIDGDGDSDLFLQERPNEVAYFENTGSRTSPKFIWRTDRFHDLKVGDWSRFVDFDGDGDLDVLSEERFSHIRAYENRGSAREPAFALIADSVRNSAGAPIFSDRQNIPFIVDLDCDGALDLFLGRIDGTVSRFEAPEAVSPGEVPTFDLLTDRFEDIEIVAQLGGTLHGANSMIFHDLDGDDDLDLLWGDFFEPGLLFIENVGNCWTPNLRVDPVPFPAADTVKTSGFNASALADLDGDGEKELYLGVLGGAYNPVASSAENFHMYRRGDDDQFELVTRSYLGTFDLGNETVPALGDLDGDGDLDLLVGSKVDPVETRVGRLHLIENIGTAEMPILEERGPMGLSSQFHQAPTLGDLDGDGDLDLVLGNWRQGVELWENDSSPEGGVSFTQVDSMAASLPRGSNTIPALGDLDGDGDLDLLIGESAGNVNFFRNEGDRGSPRFALVEEEFAGIDVGRRSAPSLVDSDGDGDLDLWVGSETGSITYYRNDGSATEAIFTLVPEMELTLYPYSTAAWGDLDGDGDRDLMTGGVGGGIVYFRRGQGG
jgi:hypothetical protein